MNIRNKVSVYAVPGLSFFLQASKKERIIMSIEKITGFTVNDLMSKSSKRELVNARFIFSYLFQKELKGCNPRRISEILKKDRTTIVYYINKCIDSIKFDRHFYLLFNQVYDYYKFGKGSNDIIGTVGSQILSIGYKKDLTIKLIEKYTGHSIKSIKSKSITSDITKIRCLLCFVLSRIGISNVEISKLINRNKQTVYRMINDYNSKHCKTFDIAHLKNEMFKEFEKEGFKL